MSKDKQPPSITYDGEVSKSELGQLRPPSKTQVNNQLETSGRTAGQQQAVNARSQQMTARAMEYVQRHRPATVQQKNPELLRGEDTKAQKTETQFHHTERLAQRAIQRDNLREVAREKTQEQAQQKEKGHER